MLQEYAWGKDEKTQSQGETKGVERQGESVLTGEWGAGIGWTTVFRGYIGARTREEIEDSRK